MAVIVVWLLTCEWVYWVEIDPICWVSEYSYSRFREYWIYCVANWFLCFAIKFGSNVTVSSLCICLHSSIAVLPRAKWSCFCPGLPCRIICNPAFMWLLDLCTDIRDIAASRQRTPPRPGTGGGRGDTPHPIPCMKCFWMLTKFTYQVNYARHRQ